MEVRIMNSRVCIEDGRWYEGEFVLSLGYFLGQCLLKNRKVGPKDLHHICKIKLGTTRVPGTTAHPA
jgi:hypothetical protein